MKNRSVKQIFVALIALLSLVLVATPAFAQKITDGFTPGNIISDEEFYQSKSLTAKQVQDFLNSKVSKCKIGESDKKPGQKVGNSEYAANCLKDFKMDTKSLPKSEFCAAYQGARQESAAEIITKVAISCNINPKVLIVMLQKEQSLITSTHPTKRQYDVAMGFACPDTGPNWSANCNQQYFGFQNQVYHAAARLQRYKIYAHQYRFRKGQTASIQYHPNPTCGSAQVYIENHATAALYNYTPYTPNKKALEAERLEGDNCSTYGNRNFFNNYRTWFGGVTIRLQTQNPAPTPAPAPGPAPKPPHSAPLPGVQVGRGWAAANTISAGDFNGDAIPDLVLRTATHSLLLYPGTNNGFAEPKVIGTRWQNFDAIFGGHDFNGDNKPDFIARERVSGRLHLYPGNGRGGFLKPQVIGNGWSGLSHLTIIPAYQNNLPAITAVDATGRLRIYLGNGRGGFSAVIALGRGWNNMLSLQGVADLNGDGRGDLIALNSAATLNIYTARGQSLSLASTRKLDHSDGVNLYHGAKTRVIYTVSRTGILRKYQL